MGKHAYLHNSAMFHHSMQETDALLSVVKDAYRKGILSYSQAFRQLLEAECCTPEIREALAV